MADKKDNKEAEFPYAVEGNDVSGFKNVSPEYVTYSSKLGKPSPAKSDDKQSGTKQDEKGETGETKQGGTGAQGSTKPSSPSTPRANS